MRCGCGLIMALLFSMPCWSQSPQPKSAETSGFCSPAVTGGNNQFTITCQGVSKEEISTLLRQNQGNVKVTLAKIQECTQEIRNVEKQQENRFDEQAHRNEEIKELVENLHLTPEKLLEKYRLGYVIFDIDYRNDVFPYQSKTLLQKYDLDWTNVGIFNVNLKFPQFKIPDDQIAVRLPDVGLMNRNGNVFRDISVGGTKKVGPLGAITVSDLEISAEILAIRKTGTVFLVGFNPSDAPVDPATHN